MSFSTDLEEFKQRVLEQYKQVYRMSVFDLFSSIIVETPVDKGVLRNNWFAEIGSPNFSKVLDETTTEAEVISRMQTKVNGIQISDTTFFTNNMPYAERIEFDGWSGKAPQGMVRVNVARWDAIVDSYVRASQ